MSGNDVDKKHVRDMANSYKVAMIEEHASYLRAGLKDRAKEVAAELKLMFGHDVDKSEKATEPEPPVERAVPDKGETETPEKTEPPVKRGPDRPRKSTGTTDA